MLNKVNYPEAQDAGTIILTGFDPDIVLSSISTVIKDNDQTPVNNYQISNNKLQKIYRTPMTQIKQIITDKKSP